MAADDPNDGGTAFCWGVEDKPYYHVDFEDDSKVEGPSMVQHIYEETWDPLQQGSMVQNDAE